MLELSVSSEQQTEAEPIHIDAFAVSVTSKLWRMPVGPVKLTVQDRVDTARQCSAKGEEKANQPRAGVELIGP